MMRPLCVIPARAGSKRLANKNLAELDGRPLVAWTIEAARSCGIFDQVYVSTEDEPIAQAALAGGATVPYRRPATLAGDRVTNVEVALHLHEYLRSQGEIYDAIVCLQPSSPLRRADQIAGAWADFVKGGADFLVSVTPVDPHDFHWAVERQGNRWGLFFGDRFMKLRQELPPVYRPNGAIKIARVEALREAGNFFGPHLAAFEMKADSSVHVATATDLEYCRALLKIKDTADATGLV